MAPATVAMRRPDRWPAWRRGGFIPLLLLSIGILELHLGYFAGPRTEGGSGWRENFDALLFGTWGLGLGLD